MNLEAANPEKGLQIGGCIQLRQGAGDSAPTPIN
jgi:hypothetical protein